MCVECCLTVLICIFLVTCKIEYCPPVFVYELYLFYMNLFYNLLSCLLPPLILICLCSGGRWSPGHHADEVCKASRCSLSSLPEVSRVIQGKAKSRTQLLAPAQRTCPQLAILSAVTDPGGEQRVSESEDTSRKWLEGSGASVSNILGRASLA